MLECVKFLNADVYGEVELTIVLIVQDNLIDERL